MTADASPVHNLETSMSAVPSDQFGPEVLPELPQNRAGDPCGPPAEYARLRAQEPISRVRLPNGCGVWILTRHDDHRQVLSDDRSTARDAIGTAHLLRAGAVRHDPPPGRNWVG